MTVTTTHKKLSFTGTGADSDLSITFEFYTLAELTVTQIVTATGARTLMSPTTNYTLKDGGAGETGTITVVDGATVFTSAMTWEVERETLETQTSTYTASGPFSASSHEDNIDKNVLALQERFTSIPDVEVTCSMTLDNQDNTAHGKVGPAKLLRGFARCVSAEHGYAAGDEVEWGIGGMASAADVTAAGGIIIWSDDTNVSCYVCETNNPAVRSQTAGTLVAITLASWKFYVHAWW